MKRLLIVPLLGLAFAASAQPPTPAVAAPSAAPAPAAEAAPAPSALPEGDVRRLSDLNCPRETGTRIVKRDGKRTCAQAGRVYSREDIERTGHTDLAQALRTLDPSIR